MKTFESYTDLEKANLTKEEVEALLKYELMELGIISPQPPILLPEEGPDLKEKTYYQPSLKPYSSLDLAFATAKEAEAFMNLKPLILDSGYPSYQKNVATPEEPKVEIVKAICKADYDSSKALSEAATRNKDANKAATDKYQQKLTDASAATQHIWDEWFECGRTKTASQQLVSTHDQYFADCDENDEIALRFLGKAYSQNEIKDAYKFLGLFCPIQEVSEAPTEEEVTA
tara:strand:+ start:1861 stop:2550 length:690 start_codon:yes stop_codon:yes gene_type:complete